MSDRRWLTIILSCSLIAMIIMAASCFWRPTLKFTLPTFGEIAPGSQISTTQPTGFLQQFAPEGPLKSATLEIRLNWTITSDNPGHDIARGTLHATGNISAVYDPALD